MKASNRARASKTQLDFELYFATEVLKLRSLHYGYWDEARPHDGIDLEEVKSAQARFTERLLEFVPPNVKSILDVGAGIGDNARALSQLGHQVTAISPDKNHEVHFGEFNDPNISFTRSTFEAFESNEHFELVLFSESHRYFDRQFGLQRAHNLLHAGGHLLVSGMFRLDNKAPFPTDYDVAELPYIRTASENGFTPIKVADITPNIFPTIEMVDRAASEFLEPTLRFAEAYAEDRSPWKMKLFRLLLAKEDKALGRSFMKLRRKTDPTRFRERFRYATILFQAN